ncbi:MAG: hypothetical protein J6W00_10850 [Lentisphaeria bacterium]|nr:hypothetical protein [Lentisphaeria bacterium]
MKKAMGIIAVIAACITITGCASTRSTITEFDGAGNIIRITETSESVIKTVTSATEDKTVVIWEDGWAGYISISSGTVDDPTPHGKIFAGKTNKGWISILPDQQGVPGIARIIQATKSDVAVSLDGISATSSEIQTGKKGSSTSVQTE